MGSPLLYLASRRWKVRVLASAETSCDSASSSTILRSLSKYTSGRVIAWRTAIEVESCALLGSRVGGSWPRSILRTWFSARSETLGAADSTGAAEPEAPGAVDGAV